MRVKVEALNFPTHKDSHQGSQTGRDPERDPGRDGNFHSGTGRDELKNFGTGWDQNFFQDGTGRDDTKLSGTRRDLWSRGIFSQHLLLK